MEERSGRSMQEPGSKGGLKSYHRRFSAGGIRQVRVDTLNAKSCLSRAMRPLFP
jgi:hypothetical protein